MKKKKNSSDLTVYVQQGLLTGDKLAFRQIEIRQMTILANLEKSQGHAGICMYKFTFANCPMK